jgi:hypothetical protein
MSDNSSDQAAIGAAVDVERFIAEKRLKNRGLKKARTNPIP